MYLKAMAYGATLWGVGAVLGRNVEPIFDPHTTTLPYTLFFLAQPAVSYLSVKGLDYIGIKNNKLAATVVASATACILDGVSLGFVPFIYSSGVPSAKVGGVLLWAVGWVLIAGVHLNK